MLLSPFPFFFFVPSFPLFVLVFFTLSLFSPIHTVPPMVWIPQQLVGAPVGYNVTLECFIEAYPISLNYWSKDDNDMIHDSSKYKLVFSQNPFWIERKTIFNYFFVQYSSASFSLFAV